MHEGVPIDLQGGTEVRLAIKPQDGAEAPCVEIDIPPSKIQ